MNDYDDLDIYNGEAVHDMWVDFDKYENAGAPDSTVMITISFSKMRYTVR